MVARRDIHNVLPEFGIEAVIIDLRDFNKVEAAIKARSKNKIDSY